MLEWSQRRPYQYRLAQPNRSLRISRWRYQPPVADSPDSPHSDRMANRTFSPPTLFIATLASVSVVVVAILPGILMMVGIGEATFGQELAILMVATLTAIWGGALAFETLRHSLTADQRHREQRAQSIAFGLRVELGQVLKELRSTPPVAHPGAILLPIFDQALRALELFPNQVAQKLAELERARMTLNATPDASKQLPQVLAEVALAASNLDDELVNLCALALPIEVVADQRRDS